MAQLLLYSSATPITVQRHKKYGVETSKNFDFAATINSVPVMTVEFAKAAREYSIVFAGEGNQIIPAVILGVENDTNLFVDSEGAWNADYVPAFVRRYPFVFSSSDDGQTFTLCIDEDYSGVNSRGRGNRLFDEDGERTDYLKGVLEFLKEYQKEFNRSQLLCEKLVELNLLEPMQAQIKLASGRQVSLTGFQAVNREKLNDLEPDSLSNLAKIGALELIYIHLFSMSNFNDMMQRFSSAIGKDSTAESVEKKPRRKKAAKSKGTPARREPRTQRKG